MLVFRRLLVFVREGCVFIMGLRVFWRVRGLHARFCVNTHDTDGGTERIQTRPPFFDIRCRSPRLSEVLAGREAHRAPPCCKSAYQRIDQAILATSVHACILSYHCEGVHQLESVHQHRV